jgi:hypothetical protein
MRYSTFISAALLLLMACNSTSDQGAEAAADSAKSELMVAGDSAAADDQTAAEGVNSVTITFDEITLKFEGGVKELSVYEDRQPKYLDTAMLEAVMGAEIGDVLVSVFTTELQDVVIGQSMRTTMTINNEGPSCELSDWKHYTMPWTAVKQITTEQFKLNGYNADEYNRFPDVTVEEVKAAAKTHCSADWLPIINNIKSLQDAYCDVVMDKVMLRVSGKKANGQKVEKYVIINMPTGC